jgi:hypothetical protein
MKHPATNSPPPFSVSTLVLILLLFTSLLLGLDIAGNSESVFKFIGIHSHSFVIPTLVVLLVIRLQNGELITKRFLKALKRITFALFIVTTVASLYDAVTPPNALFNLTRLNQSRLLVLTVYWFLILLAAQPNNWWKKYWKSFVLFFPLFVYYLAFITSHFPFDIFLQLVKEDRFIENSQFFILLCGALVSGFHALYFHTKNQWRLTVFFWCCAVGLFFIAGDEIAWGQRILGIEATETVKNLNTQDELTVHNLHAVQWLVNYGYFLASFLGIAAYWLCKKLLPKWVSFTPVPLLTGFFLLPVIFYFLQLRITAGIFHSWAEVAELYLYSGIVIWLCMMGFRQRSAKKAVGIR